MLINQKCKALIENTEKLVLSPKKNQIPVNIVVFSFKSLAYF